MFTEAERAALALTEEGTRLADAHHGVSDETWDEVRKHYDDNQLAALVALVAMINAANRLAVIVIKRAVPTSPACSPAWRADRQPNPGPDDSTGRRRAGEPQPVAARDLPDRFLFSVGRD